MTQEDYLNDMKWTEAYAANNLSRDSLSFDMRNKLK
jgi:hypothetical protein